MNKISKFFTVIVLTMCVLCSDVGIVFAKETDNYLDKVNSLALESPKEFPTTSNWINNKITHLIPLYDMNNSLYAYCVDIVNKDTGNYAYMIVLAITDTPQILEYNPNGRSPYIDINDKTAYYNGVSQYYMKENDFVFQDLTTGDRIDKEEVSTIITNNEKVNSSLSTYSIGGHNNLSGVPDYPWRKGCTPTSLAMLLKYKYGNLVDSQTTLIDRLADLCYTSGGWTFDIYVRPGVVNYLSSKGIYPSFCGFMSENWTGNPRYGKSYNSLYQYQTFINSNTPVIVLMTGAQGTSPYYTSGFGDHTVCGTGYYVGSAGEFIIVHTTQQEGDVYVAYSEYALGQFAWFTLN